MKGSEDMEGHHIGTIIRLANPLWLCLIDKTGRAVTGRAGVPAGVTSDTGGDQLFKKFPTVVCIKGFHLLYLFIAIDILGLSHRISGQFIIENRIFVDADLAVLSQHL